jgi:hypothetical protein
LGAGGRINTDVYLTDSSNAALYACFAIVGFFAGSVNNTLGPKYTLLVRKFFYLIDGVTKHFARFPCIGNSSHLWQLDWFIRLCPLLCISVGVRY